MSETGFFSRRWSRSKATFSSGAEESGGACLVMDVPPQRVVPANSAEGNFQFRLRANKWSNLPSLPAPNHRERRGWPGLPLVWLPSHLLVAGQVWPINNLLPWPSCSSKDLLLWLVNHLWTAERGAILNCRRSGVR